MKEHNTESSLVKVTHYGPIIIGDINLEAVVLADGSRGYTQRRLAQAIGFSDQFKGAQGRRFLEEIAPNALKLLRETTVPKISMPSGGWASFIPVGILTEIVSGVIEAGCAGKLHHKQLHILPRCMAILKELALTATVGRAYADSAPAKSGAGIGTPDDRRTQRHQRRFFLRPMVGCARHPHGWPVPIPVVPTSYSPPPSFWNVMRRSPALIGVRS